MENLYEKEDLKFEIGNRIKKIREEMGYTKEKFAKMLEITPQYLGIIERGGSALSYYKLEKLCKITGYASDYILFGNDINLDENMHELLSEFTREEIKNACEAIKKIAIFLRNAKNNNDNYRGGYFA